MLGTAQMTVTPKLPCFPGYNVVESMQEKRQLCCAHQELIPHKERYIALPKIGAHLPRNGNTTPMSVGLGVHNSWQGNRIIGPLDT